MRAEKSAVTSYRATAGGGWHLAGTSRKARSRVLGITLVELVIVVAIVAILAALAVPSYRNYVVRTNRTEAINALLAVAACQERVYIKDNAYAPIDRCLDDTTTQSGLYVVGINLQAVNSVANQGYTLSATPQGAQFSEDKVCRILTLNHRGQRGADNGTADAQTTASCWRG